MQKIIIREWCFSGGSVSTPLSKTENEIITQLSEEFFIACDAEAQSGKTTWIGIVRDEGNKWAVSFIHNYGDNFLNC